MSKVDSQLTAIARHGDAMPLYQSGLGKNCLVRIYPAEGGPSLIDLHDQRYIIGRGPECQLDLPDASVSRQHASIECRAGGAYLIEDLGSTNGTFVNDQPINKQFLDSGDFIRIGSHILKFLSSDHIESLFHETIYSMMITDGLTGVHNQRFFRETLERELVRSQRHKRPLSLVMLDIDHFKKINDTYGHLAGDAVLRQLSVRIQSKIRKDEVFARCGGEEFAVVLPESDAHQAFVFAERLRRLVADEPMTVDKMEISIAISAGIAYTDGETPLTAEDLIAVADRNLYRAKATGRNRVHA